MSHGGTLRNSNRSRETDGTTWLVGAVAALQQRIQQLHRQVEEQVQQRPQALRLLTHPGVGPVTALATEVFLGDPGRFANSNKVAGYMTFVST